MEQQIEESIERRKPENELEREFISLFEMTSRLEYELELAITLGDN